MTNRKGGGENKNYYTLSEDEKEDHILLPDDYKNLMKSSDKLIIVDFFAEWCGPCKMIGPKFKDMSNEFANCIFIKVDVDEFEDIAEENNISCMPTFIFFRKGEKIEVFSGANVQKLKEKIQELASK